MARVNVRSVNLRRHPGCGCFILAFVLLMVLPGCIGAGVGIVAAVSAAGIVPAAMTGAFPFNLLDPDKILSSQLGIEQRDLGTHDPKRFDPVKALPLVQSFAGDGAELVKMRATGVRRDGTIDLTASYRPTVEYEFVRRIEKPAGAPPLGAGGSIDGVWQEKITIKVEPPGQGRHITSRGGDSNIEVQYTTKGLERTVTKPASGTYPVVAAVPSCSLDDLWRVALERGAPGDAVALIEYVATGFSYSVVGTVHQFQTAPDCEVR